MSSLLLVEVNHRRHHPLRRPMEEDKSEKGEGRQERIREERVWGHFGEKNSHLWNGTTSICLVTMTNFKLHTFVMKNMCGGYELRSQLLARVKSWLGRLLIAIESGIKLNIFYHT